MNKETLTSKVATNLNVSRRKASLAVDAVLQEICNGIQEEGEVSIRDFGKFYYRTMARKGGINPKTQEKIIIPEHKRIAFKIGRSLKTIMDAKNNGNNE